MRVQRRRRGKFLRIKVVLMTTPYFKRVLEDMQSGYQADQTSSNSIYLRPRTNLFGPPGTNQEETLFNDWDFDNTLIFGMRNRRKIITRLRIWVRRVERRLRHLATNHYGGLSRNLVGRSGWDVTASLRQPTSFGEAIENRRHQHPNGRWSTAVHVSGNDNSTIWKKNQRVRLF